MATTNRVSKTIGLSKNWQDTGFTIAAGEKMHVMVSGEVKYATGKYAYPEGSYVNGSKRLGNGNPASTLTYAGAGFPADEFVVTNTAPYSVAMIVMPEGQTPSASFGAIDNALRPNRNATFPASLQTGRVWAIFNDRKYGDNPSGATQNFYITLEKVDATVVDIDPGLPSPLRYVPPGILAIKRSPEQTLAWCLAVKTRRGWEGHTGWDIPLTLPAYTDIQGNDVPPLTYYPNGASSSNLSMEIKLGVKSTDLKLFAPRYDGYALPTTFLNLSRESIYKGEYENAEWEMFEVAPLGNLSERLLWQCGHVGNVSLDDIFATIELIGWDEVPNRTIGDIFHVQCQVGSRPMKNGVKEQFGTGRCRNEVLNDGPLRVDWTVEATIIAPISYDVLRLQYGNVARSGNALPLPFPNRLMAGDVEFFDGASGGSNDGYRCGVKRGSVVSPGVVDAHIRLSLPFLPAVGDKLWLVSGCTKTKACCISYGNLPNGRMQDLPGQDDGSRRSIA